MLGSSPKDPLIQGLLGFIDGVLTKAHVSSWRTPHFEDGFRVHSDGPRRKESRLFRFLEEGCLAVRDTKQKLKGPF